MEHKDPSRRAIRVCLVAAVDKTGLLIEDDVVPYDYKASGQIEAIVRLVADGTVVLSRRSAAGLAPRLSGRSPGRLCLVLSHRPHDPPTCLCGDGALLVQSVDDAFTACAGDTLYVIGGPGLLSSFLPYASVFYKFVLLDKSVRLAASCRRRYIGSSVPTLGAPDIGPRVGGPAGLFYHVETWPLASSVTASPSADGTWSPYIRIKGSKRGRRTGFGAPDGGGDGTSTAVSTARTATGATVVRTTTMTITDPDAAAIAHIPDIDMSPSIDDEFASDMDQAIIQSQYEHWVESHRAHATTKSIAVGYQNSGDGNAMGVDDREPKDDAVDYDPMRVSDADDDFLLDSDCADDDIGSDDGDATDGDISSDSDERDDENDQADDDVVLYDGDFVDDDPCGPDDAEQTDDTEPAGCIVARLASCDTGVAWNILGRLRPADVFALARASPRLPRIMAAVLDAMPADIIDQAWPQPPDDPMWSVFTRGTTLSPDVARVGTAWLMLVGMGARLWPMSPLRARFDPTLRTGTGTLDYWKKYVDPVVHASMLGCLVVVYECLWLSVQQDPDSDRLLPAVPLAAAAASHGSLALYDAARMAAAANTVCGRAFIVDPPDRNIGYGGTLNMLAAVVTTYTRDLSPTEPPRHLSTGQQASVLTEAARDFIDAVRNGASDNNENRTTPEVFSRIDTICNRLSAWIVRQAAAPPNACPGSESSARTDAAITALVRIVQVATEQAAIGCTGIRSAVVGPLLRVLATATKGVHTGSVLLSALDTRRADVSGPAAVATARDHLAPTGDLLDNLLDHEPMLFTTAILPCLDDRDVLMLAACSRSLLHAALVWFADRRRKVCGVGCVPLAVDHIDQAGPPSEGLAIRALWLPWIESALDLIERAVLACWPDNDQTAVEPHVVDALIDALWRDVKTPAAFILAVVARAVAVGALDVLPACAKALDRLCAARQKYTDTAWCHPIEARDGAAARHRGGAAVPSRDPPPTRLLAWMQANAVPVDEATMPAASTLVPDEAAGLHQSVWQHHIIWQHDITAGGASLATAALAYAAGRLRSSHLLTLAVRETDADRGTVPPFAFTSSGALVPLFDHDQSPSPMDIREACLRAAALGVRHGPEPSVADARPRSLIPFLGDLWAHARAGSPASHTAHQADAPMTLAETVGLLLLLTTEAGVPDAQQIRSAGLAMLRDLP
ncbi:Dihydrofolate reductase incomplete domain containing protein [Pandoravirus salinus]|uniref:Dihydrofolate reductase incomplete domain containing protein n=1 Tax=Pandoravirus salinus TaxID=1349410 RepID=S4VWE4_9VIRU|nr:Dihydrofolate reductase incomplete domain [Pandoravirus salinus]AGO84683.1 Dihydrofolate reductase incomplete domain containing protein [Pandoravirus salinus]